MPLDILTFKEILNILATKYYFFKKRFQLFWRTIYSLDCESLSIFFHSSVLTYTMAKNVINEFKKLKSEK